MTTPGATHREPKASEATGCRLYLITPERIDLATFPHQLKAALEGGDVACLQLRLKNISDDEFLRAADALQPIAQASGVAFLLNDRPDLAAKCGADGVHIGQSDASYEEARYLMGPDRIVGVTCHDSRHLAIDAAEAGADYVAFGAFYPTNTKPSNFRPEPELLIWWDDIMTVPSVAIGGITPENCVPLVQAGADFIAVVSGVWDCPRGPAAAVRLYNEGIVALAT